MDLLEMYQQIDESSLTKKQAEEKLIQVIDLFYFIQCYEPSITILDWKEHRINIIEKNSHKKGLFLCDLIYHTNDLLDNSLFNHTYLNEFKEKYGVQELWFVIVEEDFFKYDLKTSEEFVKNNNADSVYDKIFYFNFSRSKIKILK